MNGIVTGKIEKIAGSMVFKSEYSQPIPPNDTKMNIYIPDKNQYLKIVDKAGNIILMKARSAPRGDSIDYDGVLTLWYYNDSGSLSYDTAFFHCPWEEDYYSFYLQTTRGGALRYYLTSVERGTLEIA